MAVEASRIVIKIETNADKASRSMGQLGQQTRQAGASAGGATKAFQALKSIGIAALAVGAAKAIGRLGSNLIQAASDAEETANKFGVTFQGVQGAAQDTARNLAENFGLAQTEAESLLANTGDLLTGFGFTRESALDLSTQVQELAVDLASFTNFSGGAEGASQALTKALLGERESLKTLGIAITQADIDRLAEDKGIVGELTRQQQAALTLQLAVEQSGNAIGDFERSQASFANQSRIANARVQDIAESLGGALLPLATLAIRAFNDIASRVAEVADRIREWVTSVQGAQIISDIFGGIAGAFGVVFDIGQTLFNALGQAWAGIIDTVVTNLGDFQTNTQNSGIALDILSGVIEGALIGFGVLRDLVITNVTAFFNLVRAARESAQAIGSLGQVLTGQATFEDVKEQFREAGDAFRTFATEAGEGLATTVRNAVEGIQGLTDNAEDRSESLREKFRQTSEETAATVNETLRAASDEAVNTAQATADSLEQVTTDSTQTINEIRQEAIGILAEAGSFEAIVEQTEAQLEREVDVIEQAGLNAALVRRQANERQARAAEEFLNQILEDETLTNEGRIRLAEDRVRQIEETEGASFAARRAARERLEEFVAEIEIQRTEQQKEQAAERLEAVRDEIAERQALRRADAERTAEMIGERREREAEERRRILQEQVDAERDARAEEVRINEEAAEDKIELARQVKDAQNELGQAAFDFASTLIDRSIEDERDRAVAQKALAVTEAIINTALAVTKALSVDPTGILAGLAAATGAIQIATILAEPIPAAQFGGSFVVPPGNNDDSGLLRVNSGEEVNVTPTRGGESSFPERIVVSIGGAEFDARVAQAFNKGSAQIRRRGAVQVNR
jgi:hypothetical protein